ncbi:hypothetical protein WAJ72_23380, partial [Acinetobacter baumannii]
SLKFNSIRGALHFKSWCNKAALKYHPNFRPGSKNTVNGESKNSSFSDVARSNTEAVRQKKHIDPIPSEH